MFACMKAKLSQKCAWYYRTGPLPFPARSFTVMFPFKISIVHRKTSPRRPHGCTTHVEHRWSKLELFSATCIIAPTQSKVVHLIDPIRRSFSYASKIQLQFARKKQEGARSLDSVLGSSLSLTLPHSYSFSMLSLKVHAWCRKPARTINRLLSIMGKKRAQKWHSL